MKNIYKLFLAVIVLVGFTACEDERFTIDPTGNSNVLVTFAETNVSLPVVIDDTGSVSVDVNVTTSSTNDRSFNLSVDAASSSADPVTFSVPATVTIPAGAFTGSSTITGTDLGVETTPESIVINIMDTDDILTAANLTVSIFQVCPINDGLFTGDYRIEVITPGVFGLGGLGATGDVVTLAVPAGGSSLERQFTSTYFSDGRFSRDFMFSLVCNETVIEQLDTRVSCDPNVDPFLVIGAAEMNGAYDPNDDSTFIINITDNIDSDCGAGPIQASFRFTKV